MTRQSLIPALPMLALLFVSNISNLRATPADDSSTDHAPSAKTESFLASLHPTTGDVSIPAAKASLRLAPGYSFLPAKDAQRVLSELWRNPPDADVLGMILPGTDPHVLLDESNWAVVVTYTEEGYVSDADAAKIDYADMLKDMQKSSPDSNPERIQRSIERGKAPASCRLQRIAYRGACGKNHVTPQNRRPKPEAASGSAHD